MKLEEGWMKQQNEIAAAATEKWPEWMKKEAGISQQSSQSSVQPVQATPINASSVPSMVGSNKPLDFK